MVPNELTGLRRPYGEDPVERRVVGVRGNDQRDVDCNSFRHCGPSIVHLDGDGVPSCKDGIGTQSDYDRYLDDAPARSLEPEIFKRPSRFEFD